MKQFAIGFNGTNKINDFLYEAEKRKNLIHDIFTECPGIDTFMTICNDQKHENYKTNCINFLEESKNSDLRITILCNDIDYYIKYTNNELQEIIEKISNAIEKYNLYGMATTNFTIAKTIKKRYPELEIVTSCNLPYYNLNHYKQWYDEGFNYINPPRDAARNIPFLKVLKENGFKIRLLINETCSITCTNYSTCGCNYSKRNCLNNNEILKRCYVLPRWLNILDEYVDIYKLNTRSRKYISSIFHPIDIYASRKDCKLSELFIDPANKNIYDVNTSVIPDSLLYCDKFHCDECKICNQLYEEYPIFNRPFRPDLYMYEKSKKGLK